MFLLWLTAYRKVALCCWIFGIFPILYLCTGLFITTALLPNLYHLLSFSLFISFIATVIEPLQQIPYPPFFIFSPCHIYHTWRIVSYFAWYVQFGSYTYLLIGVFTFFITDIPHLSSGTYCAVPVGVRCTDGCLSPCDTLEATTDSPMRLFFYFTVYFIQCRCHLVSACCIVIPCMGYCYIATWLTVIITL